jgi:hypothetical protein
MSNIFNPGFDREKASFLELANRGDGLTPINYLYAKEASFNSILSSLITGGTAEFYTLYIKGIFSDNITNTADIITQKLKWNNPGNEYFVGFQAGSLTKNTIWTLPLQDGKNGQILSTNGSGSLSFMDNGGGKAPDDATYVIKTASDALINAQVISDLGLGMAKIVAGGAFAIAIADEDYATKETLEQIKAETEEFKNQAATSAEEASTSATEASASATEASASATEATASAAEATGAAAEATGAAAEATGAAGDAGVSAVAAALSALSAGSSSSSASSSASDASSSASSAHDSAVSSAGSASLSSQYLNQLLNTGITLTGDVLGSGPLKDPITLIFKENPIFLGHQSMTIPVGTTAERPANPVIGMIRLNTDL